MQQIPPVFGFATTHWSAVVSAGGGESPEAEEALEALCRQYWFPLYAYVRREGYPVEAAQDLTQDFFARFLARQYIRAANRERGKFRSFLLTALKHFLTQEWRKGHTAKRGGGQVLVSWDEVSAEQRFQENNLVELDSARVYDRQWALTTLQIALDRLFQEFCAAGKSKEFDQYKPFLSAEANQNAYAAIGGVLGIKVGAVAVAVHRFRQRYQELVREEVSNTVARPEDTEEELRYLIALVTS